MSDGRRAGFQTQSASHTRPITVLPQYQQHQSHQSNYHTPTQEYERTQWSTIVQMYKTKYRSQAHEDCTGSYLEVSLVLAGTAVLSFLHVVYMFLMLMFASWIIIDYL